MTDKLAKRDALAIPDDRDLVKAVAMDIGKEVAAHIEIMYPEAVKAASSTFLLSVRNCTYNSIMGWMQPDIADTGKRMASRERFRRAMRAAYRTIREREQ